MIRTSCQAPSVQPLDGDNGDVLCLAALQHNPGLRRMLPQVIQRGGGGVNALEWKGPQGWPQKPLGRRLEEVAKAVGGGYCRLQMPLSLAYAVRETVAGHRLGALEEGGGVPPPLPMHPWGGGGEGVRSGTILPWKIPPPLRYPVLKVPYAHMTATQPTKQAQERDSNVAAQWHDMGTEPLPTSHSGPPPDSGRGWDTLMRCTGTFRGHSSEACSRTGSFFGGGGGVWDPKKLCTENGPAGFYPS